MTKQEIAKLLTLIKSAYPNYNRDLPASEVPLVVDFWHGLLVEYDNQVVTAALQAYSAKDTKGFAPVPGQILEEVRNIIAESRCTSTLTAEQAWESVLFAMRDSYYNSEKSFANLSPMTQEAVGSPSRLKQWGAIDEDRVETMVKPNFLRNYRELAQQRQSFGKLPSSVRGLIEGRRDEISTEKLQLGMKDFNGKPVQIGFPVRKGSQQ